MNNTFGTWECQLSHVWLVIAHQAPLSMGFSKQEYWSVLPCPPPGDLLDPGLEPTSPVALALQVDSLPLSHWGSLYLKYTQFLFVNHTWIKLGKKRIAVTGAGSAVSKLAAVGAGCTLHDVCRQWCGINDPFWDPWHVVMTLGHWKRM